MNVANRQASGSIGWFVSELAYYERVLCCSFHDYLPWAPSVLLDGSVEKTVEQLALGACRET